MLQKCRSQDRVTLIYNLKKTKWFEVSQDNSAFWRHYQIRIEPPDKFLRYVKKIIENRSKLQFEADRLSLSEM